MIEIDQLNIGYHKSRVAGPITEKMHKGELVCLLGPNGTGKSTLLKTISGLIEPIKGDVYIQGKKFADLDSRQRAKILSIVLTEPIIIGNLSGEEIVELGRYPHTGWWGKKNHEDKEIAKRALEKTGVAHLASKNISELSDGEKQKIMIARALAQDTDYILLDEPTSHLDLPSKIEIMTLLKDLSHHWNKSVLVSTHDINLALQSADKFWLIDISGNFYSGVNEDLIINGQLNKCFNLDEKTYNFSSGKINVTPQNLLKVALAGSGQAFNWTKHALERTGFQISKNSEIKIEVLTEKKWILIGKKRNLQFASISDLLQELHSIKD